MKIFTYTSTHSIISIGLFFYSVFAYYITIFLMSLNSDSDIFNSFYMIITSPNYFLSMIMLVVGTLLFDIGIHKIFLLFSVIKDPLKIKTDEYEKKYQLDKIYLKDVKDGDINNRCN